jgi:monoamine oxidase
MLEADVCIVGCGLAGLSAARTILADLSNNISVILVDGRDRPGGRTNTVSLTDNGFPVPNPSFVDIGGQWIGADHLKLLAFIKEFDLDLEDQFYPHDENEEECTYSLANLVSMISYNFPPLLAEEVNEVNAFVLSVDQLGAELSMSEPWNVPNAFALDISIHDYVTQNVASPRAHLEVLTFIQTILACDPADVSFLFFLYYIASGGGIRALGDGVHGAQKWKLRQGAQAVSNRLLASISNPASERSARVMLSSRVTDISLGSATAGSSASVVVITSAASIKCKRVLLAMSPRLAVSSIQFSPPLPPAKAALAQHMVPGSVVKVICVYSEAFWLHTDTSEVGTCSLPSLYPVHNFFHATVEGLPALVGLITGDAAKRHALQSPEERRQSVLDEINFLFTPDKSKDQPPPRPIAYVEKDWASEEFSGGCFACLFRPNSFVKSGPHLKTPLSAQSWSSASSSTNKIHQSFEDDATPIVFFASTETAPLFSGYMEGAILAGEATANEVVNSLNTTQSYPNELAVMS